MSIGLSPEEQLDLLRRGHTAVLTTLRRDGWPVSLPVWYAVVEGRIYVMTPAQSAKVGRIRRDDRCSFLVETGHAWVELAAVELPARAIVLEPGRETAAAMAALDDKYNAFRPPAGELPEPVRRYYADSVVIRLDRAGPARSWDNARIRMNSRGAG